MIRNPMLRGMLGLPLLLAASVAGSSEIPIPRLDRPPAGPFGLRLPSDPLPPATGRRSEEELATDPKLAPASQALSAGCSLAHPRAKTCISDLQHATSNSFHICRAGSFGVEHRLTKSQRRVIREADAMHRKPGGGRDNG